MVVPAKLATVRATRLALPKPGRMPHETVLKVSHDAVGHGVVPTNTLTLRSLVAKFVPTRVRTEPPVGGLLGVTSWVTTGESKVNWLP